MQQVRERIGFGACTIVGLFVRFSPSENRIYYRDRRTGVLKWINLRRWMVHLDPCPHCEDRDLVQSDA